MNLIQIGDEVNYPSIASARKGLGKAPVDEEALRT
jgi:hypothetical protein